MSSLPMLISLIETGIKEKTIDKMYDDFLEEALKMGLSSYTLNTLISNARKKLEYNEPSGNDDLISPFVYRRDIIKPKPEVVYKVQEKIVFKNKKGLGIIIAALFILSINIGIIALFCQSITKNLYALIDSLDYTTSQIEKIKSVFSTTQFDSWQSTNKEHLSKDFKDYICDVKSGYMLSFKYEVSSERTYDKLNVYLMTTSDTTRLLTKSGVESGTKKYNLNQDGTVTIRFEYSKDGSVHEHDDFVKITDIKVYRPSNLQVKEIKEILNYGNEFLIEK